MPPTSAAKPISYAQSTGLPISPKRFQSSAPAPRKARANISPKVCSVSGPMWISGYMNKRKSACGARLVVPGDQHLQQRLLRVQTVLGLVPDGGAASVEDLGADLLAGVGRQAVEDDRALLGDGEQIGVELERGEVGEPTLCLGLVAHADPDIGVERVGFGGGGARVVAQLRAGDLLELVALGCGDHDFDPGALAEDRQRAGDVVSVANVGEAEPVELAEALAQRQQVGERLAGVVQRRQTVDHRHLG